MDAPIQPIANPPAILIVNGGRDPEQGTWLSLCLGKILEHTTPGTYSVYVWNNNVEDPFVEEYLRTLPGVKLVQAPAGVALSHPHADPLQRLYELAKADGAKTIVTMDSDAHPMRAGWLEDLVKELDGGAVLAGVWRDELHTAIAPYLHASCLATTVEFIETNGLRLDIIPENKNGVIHDTLSELTRKAEAVGGRIHAWKRSNRRQFHRLMGGIYGDSIYHHGAGSRTGIRLWDEPRKQESMQRNDRIRQVATDLLLTDYDLFMGWLSGRQVDGNSAKRLDQLAAEHAEWLNHHGENTAHGLLAKFKRKLKRWLGLGRDHSSSTSARAL